MDNVPQLPSFFGGSEASISPAPTQGTDDTALSPSSPPLTLEGVGAYDDTIGVSLAKAEEIWKAGDDKTREVPYSLNGMRGYLAKDGSGTFKKGNTLVRYRVEDQLREIHLEEDGPDGTIYTGMTDVLFQDDYDKLMGRQGRKIVSVFYHIPSTRAGEKTQVGLQWVSPYVPSDALVGRSFVPERRDLVVPSVAFDGLSSKYNPDGSLNVRKLNVAKPLSRFSSNHPLSAQLTTEGQAPDMIVTEGF
jgi:hypothetical protein